MNFTRLKFQVGRDLPRDKGPNRKRDGPKFDNKGGYRV